MIKSNVSGYKFFKTFIAFSFITLPSLGFSGETLENKPSIAQGNYALIEEFLESHSIDSRSELENARSVSLNARMPKSLQGSLDLLGTWILSNPHNAPQTDKIIINGNTTNPDGSISAVGNYFLENSTSGFAVICLDNDESAYICFANNPGGGFVAFLFTINGNIITSGWFGMGDTILDAESVALSSEIPLFGYRLSSGVKVDVKGDLIIPAVEYNGQFYRVILKDQGGFLFGIKEVGPVN